MLHPFITQSWCASGEPPWMPRPTTSESSGNSSSELIRIPSAMRCRRLASSASGSHQVSRS
jgi:hypothetical protein